MSETPDFDVNARDRDNAIPTFERKAVRGPDKDGQPTFVEQEFVLILVPGDRKTEWYGRVTDEHRVERFPKQYAAWKAGQEAPTEGTPLSDVAWIGRAQAEELAYQHVKTVEQLANLSDAQLKGAIAMAGYQLRDRAKRHIEELKGAAPAEKQAAENAELKSTISQMQGQMAEMMERLAKAEAPKAPAASDLPAA